MMLRDLAGKRVTVAGLGHFGGNIAAAKWLVEQGARVLVTDRAPADKLADSVKQLQGLPIDFRLGGHELADFNQVDLVVASPAIPPSNQYLTAARAMGVPVTTEICLFLERCPAAVIGVTGTKGKSTTSAMLGQILQKRHTTWFGGNIGKSLLPELANIKRDHLVVLELSSFMLHYTGENSWSPHVAVVTMLAPDHLDWHGTFDAYADAKMNILKHQRGDDVAVLNEESAELLRTAGVTPSPDSPGEGRGEGGKEELKDEGRRMKGDAASSSSSFSLHPSALSSGPHPNPLPEYRERGPKRRRTILYGVGGRRLFDLCIPGRHNQLNAQGAYAAASVFGVTWDDAQAALGAFKGLPHRLQLVHESDGVRWFNDSIATIPEAAVAAMRAFERGRVIQIVGGSDKGLDMTPMVDALSREAKAVLCIGTTGPAVAERLRSAGARVVRECADLATAVSTARELATPGDVVLLSTGFASYDQFVNFEDRGEQFAALAQAQAL